MKTEGQLTYLSTSGSPLDYEGGGSGQSTRIDVYPDGGMWDNDTDFNWENNPGYLYTKKGIKNGEFTTFIRVHDDVGTDDEGKKHHSFAHKIGGRDEDNLRSLFEMVHPTKKHSDIHVNYNYAHFPYVPGEEPHASKINILFNPPILTEDKWIGVKTIHKVADDNKSTHWEMWVDKDPIDNNGKPKNGWKLAATYEDKGIKNFRKDDKTFNYPPLTWRCHKDVCRVDGYKKVDFVFISDREVDPKANPSIP